MRSSTPFMGRDAELSNLGELLAEHRLVTVTGPGGIGKTRLVTEAEAKLDELFDDVMVARLADLDIGADASQVSAQLDMSSPEALALSIRELTVLVVLDNCEHVLDGAADFVLRLLAASESVSVLTTGREPLRIDGEVVLPLDPLVVPAIGDPDALSTPAVALFLDRSQAAGARWERTPATVDAIAELCRQVDGLPLAIELAASRARALSPSELLMLMGSRLDALQSRDRGRPARHQSVRAAIDVSVELLDEESRRFFLGLGVFAGAFELDLAHEVVGPDPDDVLHTVDLITELVNRSLLVAETAASRTRYRLLELVREYAADQLRSTGRWYEVNEVLTDALVRKADAIVAQALQGWSAELVRTIAANLTNTAAAIDWCIEHDEAPTRAVRLFLPLLASTHQSRSPDVRAIGRRAFERWPDTPAPFRGEALAVLATAYAIGSMSDDAARTAREALADPSVSGIGCTVAERALMLAALGRDDLSDALDHAQRGRALAVEHGFSPFARELMAFEASILDQLGETERAAALADEAAAASMSADDPITEIWARVVGAVVALRDDRFGDATALFERAKQRGDEIDNAWWSGAILRLQSLLASYDATMVAVGTSWNASRPSWREAIERAARRGDLPELAVTLKSAAVVAARAGQLDVAHTLLDAVPESNELTVLPETFPDERRALEASYRGAPSAGRASTVVGVRRALAAMADDAPDDTPAEEGARAAARPGATGALRREGDVWHAEFSDNAVKLRDLKGLRDIAVLLGRPGTEVHCLELMGAGADQGGAGPSLDERARREYQDRILDLQSDIDEARAMNDLVRAERAETELDQVVQHLSSAMGLGGRARETGSAAERARTAVTYRIRAAMKRVHEAHPPLGRHLDASIRTGTWCAYRPEVDISWDLRPS